MALTDNTEAVTNDKMRTFPQHVAVFPELSLRSQLIDAIIELCRRESFYVEELRIEGTICVVSDRSAALIVQITEQVGNNTERCEQSTQLPVVVTSAAATYKVDVGLSAHSDRTDSDRGAAVLPTCRCTSAVLPTCKHPGVGRRLRVCRYCGAHFLQLGSLRSHVRRRHCSKIQQLQVSPNQLSRQPGVTEQLGVTDTAEQELNSENNVLNMKSEPVFGNEALFCSSNVSDQQMQQAMMSSQQHTDSIAYSTALNGSGSTVSTATNIHSQTIPDPIDDFVVLHRSADGKFACPFCSKSYGFKHSLKEHINVHRGRRPHVCQHCGAAFAHLASLCAHIRRRHDDQMPADFRCTLCGEKLMNLQSLKQHRTWRHKDAPRLSDPLPPRTPALIPQSAPAPECSPVDQKPVNVDLTTPGEHLSASKKDVGVTVVGHVNYPVRQCSVGFPSSSSNITSSSAGCVSDGFSAASSNILTDTSCYKMLPLRVGAGSALRGAANLPAFDGFDFRNYLPADLLSTSGAHDWIVDHTLAGTEHVSGIDTRPVVSSTNNRLGMSFSNSTQQSTTQSNAAAAAAAAAAYDDTLAPRTLHVCPSCSAKFRSDSDFKRHIACHPDHISLSWRQ